MSVPGSRRESTPQHLKRRFPRESSTIRVVDLRTPGARHSEAAIASTTAARKGSGLTHSDNLPISLPERPGDPVQDVVLAHQNLWHTGVGHDGGEYQRSCRYDVKTTGMNCWVGRPLLMG